MDLSLPATKVDSDTDNDERFLLPRRPPNAVRDEASSTREVQTGRTSSPAREFDMAMDDSSDEDEPTQVDLGSTEKQWVSPVPVENRFQVLSGQKSVTESCDCFGIRELRLGWSRIWLAGLA